MQIHQIWLSEDIPAHIQAWMCAWQQSGNEYKLWRATDVVQWLPELEATGLIKLAPALQSDLLRLFILKEHGGLYVDCDCELIQPIPSLPLGMVGHWYEGADPFIINVLPNDPHIQFMLDYGYKQAYTVPEIYRWGFKAFNACWPGLVLDVQHWCAHRSQHSWGNSHQEPPRIVEPTLTMIPTVW